MAGGFWPTLMAQREAGWNALRNLGPVVALPPGIDTSRLLRPAADVYHITRRRDVIAALHDTETFSSALRAEYERFPGLDVVDLPPIPTGLDPPEHTHYLKILQPLFSRAAVAELVPTLTRQATTLIDAVAADGHCDAVTDVVAPYAAEGFQAFFGLPPQDVEKLSWWRHTVLTAPPGFVYYNAVADLFGYFDAALAQRRRTPGCPGVLAGLAGAALSPPEALAAAFMLFGGGVNNEGITAAFALSALAADPALRRLLRADPAQTELFIDEILRLEPPVSGIPRITTRDVDVGGVTIPAGVRVKLRVGAINREDGDDDVSVADGQLVRRRHWTFGAGPHRCPAANLVRVELTVLITEWLRRIPDFELEPGYSPPIHDVAFDGGSDMLASLPLRWAVPPPCPHFAHSYR